MCFGDASDVVEEVLGDLEQLPNSEPSHNRCLRAIWLPLVFFR